MKLSKYSSWCVDHAPRLQHFFYLPLLTSEKEGTHTSIFGDLIDMADKDNKFPNNINTWDETWCLLYDRQAKRQSYDWKLSSSPRSKKFRVDGVKGKVMLYLFFFF